MPAQNVLYYHDVDHNNADDADDDDDNVDDVGDDNLYRWLWLLGNREPGKSILTTLLIMMMIATTLLIIMSIVTICVFSQ